MLAQYEPTNSYSEHQIEGFSILASSAFRFREDHLKEVLEEASRQLISIGASIPRPSLSRLSTVRIWVEWALNIEDGAKFHPSEEWLRSNGHNPEKAASIEITNSKNFLAWSRDEQPSMLLHEFSHAYYFLELGDSHPEVRAAYEAALSQGIYDSVPHVSGERRRAYAIENEQEYFAELSEAFFGKNDYFPFLRHDLRTHDREGYGALRQAWGV